MFSRDSALGAIANELASKKDVAAVIVSKNECGAIKFAERNQLHFKRISIIDCNNVEYKDFVDMLMDALIEDNSPAQQVINLQLQCARAKNSGNLQSLSYALERVGETYDPFLLMLLHAEKLSDVSMSELCFVIKHAPANMKVAVHSIDFPKFSPDRIGDIRPIIVNDDLICGDDDISEFKAYFEGLDEEQKALYVYLRDINRVSNSIIRSLTTKEKATQIIANIKAEAMGKFVYSVNNETYALCTYIARYLDEQVESYKEKFPEIFAVNAHERVADFLAGNAEYAPIAFNLYRKIGRFDKMNEVCAFIAQHDMESVGRLAMVYIVNKEFTLPAMNNAPYYNVIRAYNLMANGQYAEAHDLFMSAYDYFRSVNDVCGMTISLMAILRMMTYGKNIHYVSAEDIKAINAGISEIKGISSQYHNYLLGLSVRLRSLTDAPIMIYQEAIYEMSHKRSPFYIYDMEGLIKEYIKLGNFRQASDVLNDLRKYLPKYIVPYDIITCRYFLGGVDDAAFLANEAETHADKYDIDINKSDLYMIQAKLAFYHSRNEEAFDKIDKALKSLDINDIEEKEKYFAAISYKYIMRAKFGDVNLIKDLALSYVKYCEKFEPIGLPYMECSLAYAYALLGDKEKAYNTASDAIKKLQTKNVTWLICMGITTAHMLKNNNPSNGGIITSNILCAAHNYGMNMVFVDHYEEIFGSIANYAQINGIELEFVNELERAYSIKNSARSIGANFSISMFGEVVITCGGKTVQWKTRKSRDLFLLYIMAGNGGLDRATIIDYLWNGYLYESAINNLKTTNNIIRNTLKACGLKFDLDYINTKYVLRATEIDNDHDKLKDLLIDVKKEHTSDEYVAIINNILKIYKGDFATDLNFPEFVDERNTLKHEVRMALVGAVRTLEKEGNYLEAKRVLTSLVKIDKKFDYSHMQSIIDSKLGF